MFLNPLFALPRLLACTGPPGKEGKCLGQRSIAWGRGVEGCGRAAKSSVRTRPEWNLYFSSTPPTNLCHVDLTLTHLIQLEMTNFYSATAAAEVGGAPGRLRPSAIVVSLCTTPQKCRFSPSQKTAAPQPHSWLCNQKGPEGRTLQARCACAVWGAHTRTWMEMRPCWSLRDPNTI